MIVVLFTGLQCDVRDCCHDLPTANAISSYLFTESSNSLCNDMAYDFRSLTLPDAESRLIL